MTIQQIQLMQSDLPHTLYKHKKDSGKAHAGQKPKVSANDPAFAKQREAYEKKMAKLRAKQEGKEPFTMEELFGM